MALFGVGGVVEGRVAVDEFFEGVGGILGVVGIFAHAEGVEHGVDFGEVGHGVGAGGELAGLVGEDVGGGGVDADLEFLVVALAEDALFVEDAAGDDDAGVREGCQELGIGAGGQDEVKGECEFERALGECRAHGAELDEHAVEIAELWGERAVFEIDAQKRGRVLQGWQAGVASAFEQAARGCGVKLGRVGDACPVGKLCGFEGCGDVVAPADVDERQLHVGGCGAGRGFGGCVYGGAVFGECGNAVEEEFGAVLADGETDVDEFGGFGAVELKQAAERLDGAGGGASAGCGGGEGGDVVEVFDLSVAAKDGVVLGEHFPGGGVFVVGVGQVLGVVVEAGGEVCADGFGGGVAGPGVAYADGEILTKDQVEDDHVGGCLGGEDFVAGLGGIACGAAVEEVGDERRAVERGGNNTDVCKAAQVGIFAADGGHGSAVACVAQQRFVANRGHGDIGRVDAVGADQAGIKNQVGEHHGVFGSHGVGVDTGSQLGEQTEGGFGTNAEQAQGGFGQVLCDVFGAQRGCGGQRGVVGLGGCGAATDRQGECGSGRE